MMSPIVHEFPAYTPGERRADAVVHALGGLGAGVGSVWLLSARICCLSDIRLLSLIAYLGGLGGMVLASAAYNFVRSLPVKEILRRVDHAMIFAMIAGTYTPIAVRHLMDGEGRGTGLWIVWSVACAGIVLKLVFPRRLERFGLALCLGLGWAIVVLSQPIWASMSTGALILLAGGGLLYTVGTAIHLMERLAYHNAIWHALVFTAAACHFAAIALETAP
jgi:hemolysin III